MLMVFSMLSSRLIHGYSPNRKQRTNINSAFSSWEEIFFDVHHGAIIRPLLFNIFVCNLFCILSNTDFTSYAEDATPYVIEDGVKKVIDSLKNDLAYLFYWFACNQMKVNPTIHLIAINCI